MPLHAYLPQDRRRAIAQGRDLPERCRGAALFADISGFTNLTETLAQGSGQRRGADELARRINAVHQALVSAVEAEGGSVVAFAGDGLTCWFEGDGGPAQALRCGHAMHQALASFPSLSVKVGVAAGSALRCAVGDPAIQRLDLLAGATVARAFAAQARAVPGEVQLDETTVRLVQDAATEPVAAASEPEAALDPAVLRPWILPFVFQRETASGGLFAADLRPAAALFLRVALGVAPVPDSGPTEAEALRSLVARVQRTLQPQGGVLLEAGVDDAGTCLYASFGAAQVHEDDAGRALRAALALRRECEDAGWPAQIGLSAGTMFVGGYGGSTRRSFGAVGDEVNAAARLMALARPGEVLVSGRLRQAVAADDFSFEARPPVALKGKAEPMAVFAATGLQQRRAIRLQEPPSLLPMVGREAETQRLRAALAAARAGAGQVVRVIAEAGMGKSRLVAEGIRLARREGFTGYGSACRQDGVRTPYLAWQGIWTAFFDLDPALPQRRQRQAVQAALQRHAPDHAEAWPLLGATLGQDWPDSPFTAALQPKDRKVLLEALLLQCLQSGAAEAAEDGMGLLLVLEDLHAADPLSLDMLAALVRGSAALPVLVLTAERPPEGGAADPLADRLAGPVQRIELGGLAPASVEQLVRARLALRLPERTGPLPRELLARVTARAQGNPFCVEELLDYLHDRGLDPYRPETALSLELPASLHSLVLSRIDRLSPRQQSTLKAASVIGREFARAAPQAYCPTLGTAEAVAADVLELARQGFTPVLPDGAEPGHLFRHLVTWEASYESIALDTRARLHGQYARHLEQRHPEGLHLAPLLAHHYEQAACAAEAAHWLRVAGEQAAARFANEEALACFERALRWLPGSAAAARFDLLVLRQPILDLLGRHDLQRQELDALEPLASALPDASQRRATAATLRARLAIELGDYATARASARAALAALDNDPAPRPAAGALRLDALQQLARVMLLTGEGAAARPVLDSTLALARSLGLAAAQARAHSNIGHLHWHEGRFDEAATQMAQALALARQDSDLRTQLNILNSLGVVAKARSRFDESARHYEEALQIARRIGDRPGEAMLLNNLGSACLAGARPHEAGRHCEQAARMFAETGETVQHGVALANRAEAHRELGQPAQAQALSQQALAVLRAAGSRPGEALVLENLGLAEAALGRAAEAEARLREALQIAREIGLPAREASVQLQLGRLRLEQGASAAATGPLDRAEALARTLGDETLALAIDAAQALRLLAQQAPAAAVERLQRLLPRLLETGAAPWPMELHAAALQVLQAAGDERAQALQERGRAELRARADAIADAAARRDFLGLDAHRAFMAP